MKKIMKNILCLIVVAHVLFLSQAHGMIISRRLQKPTINYNKRKIVTTAAGCAAAFVASAKILDISIKLNNKRKINEMKDIIEKDQRDKFYKIKSLVYDKELTSSIIQNIHDLMHSVDNELFIDRLITDDPDALKYYITQNLTKLLATWAGNSLIRAVIRKEPNMLTSCITQNFKELLAHSEGRYNIAQFCYKKPDIISPYIIQNLDTIIYVYKDSELVKVLIENKSDALIPYAIENFKKLANIPKGRYILETLIRKNPEAAQEIALLSLRNNDYVEKLF